MLSGLMIPVVLQFTAPAELENCRKKINNVQNNMIFIIAYSNVEWIEVVSILLVWDSEW